MWNPFTLVGAKVIDAVGNALDKNLTSTEERLAKRNELEKIRHDYKTEQLQRRTDLAALQVQANIAASNPNARRTWRDAVGYTAAAAFAVTTFIHIVNAMAPWFGMERLELTEDFHDANKILIMLLGGTHLARTVEKSLGVARGQIPAGTAKVVDTAKALLKKVRG